LQAETYQSGSTNDTHGTSGPIKVSFAPNLHSLADDFLHVAAALDKERTSTDDANDFHTTDSYGVSYVFNYDFVKRLTIFCNISAGRGTNRTDLNVGMFSFLTNMIGISTSRVEGDQIRPIITSITRNSPILRLWTVIAS
jgi:hypothetical protein